MAFEIARRHRFVGDLAALPEDIDGARDADRPDRALPRYTDLSQFRYRDTSKVRERIARAHEASARYLDEHGLGDA